MGKFEVEAVRVYREPTQVPCNGCPFRRKAMQGWLGEGSPESFIDCINRDDPLPCHQTIDYEDPYWKTKWEHQVEGKMCAGALVLTANMLKTPRDRAFPRMGKDKETVFASAQEFVRYHREAPVQSWDDRDQNDESKWLQKVFADAAKEAGQPYIENKPKRPTRRKKG